VTDKRGWNALAVLIVDDEEYILTALMRLFLDEAFTILTARSGQEGLEVIKKNDVAVIVSDQRMPGMMGADFLARSREIRPDAVRMILTGYADVASAIDAINRGGAYRYITKPWNDEELRLAIYDALERYQLIAENRRLTALTIQQNNELKKWSSELEIYVQQQTIDLSKRNKELEQLNIKLKKNFHDMIAAFLKILELRDNFLYRHSLHVAELVDAISTTMGLSSETRDPLIVAAQLHDIGMLKTPETSFLTDVKDLSAEEQREYAIHPIRGQSVLAVIEDMKQVGIWIRNHHEWYNGAGFPDRLQGEAIPLGSRIISLADAFDLNMCRHGYVLQAVPEVLAKIRGLLGIRFDPRLFEPLVAATQRLYADEHTGTGDEQDIVIELPLDRLMEGMVLARDIRSGSGLLLLGKGVTVSSRALEGLKRYHAVDPLKEKIAVYTKVKQYETANAKMQTRLEPN
jgi:response regulator RpfG family c-di-GMP phosphodiesterase